MNERFLAGRAAALIVAFIALALLLVTSHTAAASAAAQTAPPACSAVIPVFEDAIANCREINSNYACYGAHNTKGEATARPSEKLRFQLPEDRAPIERFHTLQTLPYRTTYGVALMRLIQEGQSEPVTSILFGDAQLSPAEAAVGRVFTMKSVGQNLVCQETPPGLVIRVPSGRTGRITINGIDITLGSTAFITQLSETQYAIVNLEGRVSVVLPLTGDRVSIPPGSEAVVTTQNGEARAFTEPSESDYADSVLLQWLARTGLPRVIDPNSQVGSTSLPPAAAPDQPPSAVLPPAAGSPDQPPSAGLVPGAGSPGEPAVPPASAVGTTPGGSPTACGGPIAFGQSIVQANTTPGQECVYQFCANAGDTVTVKMDTVRGNLDPYLDLRAPDRRLIKWNDDVAPGADTDSLICNQPLPVSSCRYTVVARSFGNDSSGAFRISLDRNTACVQPPPQCTIVASEGVSLRSGPGLRFDTVGTLAAGTKLTRVQSSEDNTWMQVSIPGSNQEGWVTADEQTAYCDDPSPGAGTQPGIPPGSGALPPGARTPTPTPTLTPTSLAPITPTPTSFVPLPPTPTPTSFVPLPPTPTPTLFAPLPPTPTPTLLVPLPPTPTPTLFVPLPPTPTPTLFVPLPPTPTPTSFMPVPVPPTPTPTLFVPLPPTPTPTSFVPVPVPPTATPTLYVPLPGHPGRGPTKTPHGNQGPGNGVDPRAPGCVGKSVPGCVRDDDPRGRRF